MIEFAPYLSFAFVSLMMALSPGPSWVYTVSTTVGLGRRAGMVGNFGNSTGILFHAIAATAGLSALLSYSAAAFHSIKLLGALYLVYLGINAIRGRGILSASPDRSSRSLWQVYRDGALVSVLNPKISILFIALLPQFVAPSASGVELQIAIMGAMHALIACIVHTHVVFFSGAVSYRLKSSGSLQAAMRWLTGSLFIGFGMRLAFADRC